MTAASGTGRHGARWRTAGRLIRPVLPVPWPFSS